MKIIVLSFFILISSCVSRDYTVRQEQRIKKTTELLSSYLLWRERAMKSNPELCMKIYHIGEIQLYTIIREQAQHIKDLLIPTKETEKKNENVR